LPGDEVPTRFRIGADENGLGARLGPLVVTATLARVDERGERALARKLPKKLSLLLGDSKELMRHGDVAVGEAWARALIGPAARTPEALFSALSLEGQSELMKPCPRHVAHQCWSPENETFVADQALVDDVRGALDALRDRGIEPLRVQSSVLCTDRLNREKAAGRNRFVVDLHAMERLVLSFREEVGSDVVAICGKVGGMGDYPRFFGPLGGWLHVVLEQRRACSAYRFPGVGEIHFVQDADGRDALVMMASLVGKYVRELLMARVSRWYESEISAENESLGPSGYNDPVTARFVDATELVRKRRRVPENCFERTRGGDD
jgi:hypothetical protein